MFDRKAFVLGRELSMCEVVKIFGGKADSAHAIDESVTNAYDTHKMKRKGKYFIATKFYSFKAKILKYIKTFLEFSIV